MRRARFLETHLEDRPILTVSLSEAKARDRKGRVSGESLVVVGYIDPLF